MWLWHWLYHWDIWIYTCAKKSYPAYACFTCRPIQLGRVPVLPRKTWSPRQHQSGLCLCGCWNPLGIVFKGNTKPLRDCFSSVSSGGLGGRYTSRIPTVPLATPYQILTFSSRDLRCREPLNQETLSGDNNQSNRSTSNITGMCDPSGRISWTNRR